MLCKLCDRWWSTQWCRYWGLYPNTTTLEQINQYFKPYKYGHATEMTAFANGSYRLTSLCICALPRLMFVWHFRIDEVKRVIGLRIVV